jgi:pyrroline-5-carboxylate reductase
MMTTGSVAATSVGFIGLGNMGGALASGLVRSGRLAAANIAGFDTYAGAAPGFEGLRCASVAEVAERSEVLVLAVKPHLIGEVCAEVARGAKVPSLVISIAAGVSLARIRAALGGEVAVVRAMPNLAATLGCSATALFAAPEHQGWLGQAEWLFEAVGSVVRLPREADMHPFTAVASSGPAFACLFAEALADAGVHEGLTRETARVAVAAMLRGAAEMLSQPGATPAAIKDAVSSPGGTTIAGLAALESGAFRGSVMAAVIASTKRSRSLSEES